MRRSYFTGLEIASAWVHRLLAAKGNDFASIHAAAEAILRITEEANPHASGSSQGVSMFLAAFISRPLNGKQGEPFKLLMSRKSAVHASFFAQWGTSLSDLERTPESPATTAYGAFLIDTGLQGRSRFDLRFSASEIQLLIKVTLPYSSWRWPLASWDMER